MRSNGRAFQAENGLSKLKMGANWSLFLSGFLVALGCKPGLL
jgi:hypothetical protein